MWKGRNRKREGKKGRTWLEESFMIEKGGTGSGGGEGGAGSAKMWTDHEGGGGVRRKRLQTLYVMNGELDRGARFAW